jgi:hypothetical protein
MTNLITVVGITIVSLLLASPFFLRTQEVYGGRDFSGQGYENGRQDRINGYGCCVAQLITANKFS